MDFGPIACGPSTAAHFSAHINNSAIQCMKNGGYYYNGCEQRCIFDPVATQISKVLDIEEAIYGVIFPVLVLFAVLANLAVALVLNRRNMITPTNVVLKYMAIAELLVGLVPLPWTLFFFTLGNHKKLYRVEEWWCTVQKWSMDALPPIFHNTAMWLTVLLAAQRYVSISYPLYSRTACSIKNVRIATIIITVTSLLCGLPKSFDQYPHLLEAWIFHKKRDDTLEWTYARQCVLISTPIMNALGATLYYNLYFLTRTVFFIILPSVLLIILNFLLIKGIRKAQKRKLRLLREKRSEEAARQRDSNSTSLMLILILSIYLVVNLPQGIFISILCFTQTFNIRIELLETSFPQIFLPIINIIVLFAYPINFGIYCFMSSRFRQTFKDMFCSWLFKSEFDTKRTEITAFVSRKSEYHAPLAEMCDQDHDGVSMSISREPSSIIRQDPALALALGKRPPSNSIS